MTDKAVFSGTYADMKFIRSRRVAQVIVELPIEDAGRFVEAFGAPNPATETWVAIARLQEPVKAQEPVKEKRRFSELPPSQQAAMRCGELGFQRFVKERTRGVFDYETSPDAVAVYVRNWCNVESRSDIVAGTIAGDLWKELDDAYFGWSRGYA